MNNYIDCHSHILFGIDDGSKNIDMSLEIINKMINLGFKSIVLTPHYISYYHANNMIKRKILSELNNKLSSEGIDIKLYLANEVRITSDILSLIKNDEISLLGNYLFLELPFDQRIYNLENIIYELQSNNINIILVHPERYAYLTKDDYQKLLDSDVIFQANYESIIGKYGSGAKKRVKYLLSNKMITLLATDVHRPTTMIFSQWDKIERKIKKYVGTEEYKNLTYNNINNILNSIRS